MTPAPIAGTVESGFEQVRDSFERGLARGELGAAVCVYLDGRRVVDLWGGWADEAKTREWQHGTIAEITPRRSQIRDHSHRVADRAEQAFKA